MLRMPGNEAERLLRGSTVVDAHFDLAMDIQDKWDRGRRNVLREEYLPSFRRGGLDLVVSSIFLHSYFLPEMALRKALTQIGILKNELDGLGDQVRLVTSPEDMDAVRKEGLLGILLSFEGLDPIGNDLDLLRVFYDLGVRGAGLVWSRRNYVGDGCFLSQRREGRKGGLTDFGVRVVQKAAELGMYIDVSHLNDEGFWDVMEHAEGPVIASHSNCRALVDSPRNLTDEQIQAIAQKGGVIGMNAYAAYVAGDFRERRAGAGDLVDHLDHVVGLVGVEHVGIGFDFCSNFEDFMSFDDGELEYDLFEGHQEMHLWVRALLERGYGTAEVQRILGGNFWNFLKRSL
ncbi:MAG: dipeptidase [Synergistales bacterium]|nr:dipeptidase [Synergistales bacterium]